MTKHQRPKETQEIWKLLPFSVRLYQFRCEPAKEAATLLKCVSFRAGEMVPRGNALACRPANLSLISRTHMVAGETQFLGIIPYQYVCHCVRVAAFGKHPCIVAPNMFINHLLIISYFHNFHCKLLILFY